VGRIQSFNVLKEVVYGNHGALNILMQGMYTGLLLLTPSGTIHNLDVILFIQGSDTGFDSL
jgi:hypothetical protein